MTGFTAKRGVLYRRQVGLCFWCFRPCDGLANADDAPTLDHIVPRSDNGKVMPHRLENLVMSCKRCNELSGKTNKVKRREFHLPRFAAFLAFNPSI